MLCSKQSIIITFFLKKKIYKFQFFKKIQNDMNIALTAVGLLWDVVYELSTRTHSNDDNYESNGMKHCFVY